jgi:hypothetical protein
MTFEEELQGKSKKELLDLLYSMKRAKDPEKYKLIERAFSQLLTQQAQREVVQKWVDALPGTSVRVRDYKDPVRIVSAQINSRGNAAIVQLEGEEHIRYFAYQGEE